ncbi:hypothetical protein GCM10009706_17490 [Curtobacterium citreum]|nr:hypothetical protein GCM10009706_17490 [Curtobacterium citreum]
MPDAAELPLFVMLAANPERVPVSERESRTAAKMPATRATGAKRTRFIAEVRSLDTVYLIGSVGVRKKVKHVVRADLLHSSR